MEVANRYLCFDITWVVFSFFNFFLLSPFSARIVPLCFWTFCVVAEALQFGFFSLPDALRFREGLGLRGLDIAKGDLES